MHSGTSGLVSIITPVYNSSKFVAATIESVLTQTYRDWEMILVDDCSTDNSLEVLERYAEKDSRIKVIRKEKNEGQIATRNIALDHAAGEYIAYLDSDDLWAPEKLEKQIKILDADNDIYFVHSYYSQIDEDGNALNKIITAPENVGYSKLLRTNYIGCLTVVYNANVTGKEYMPPVGKRDDWACWLNILRKGYNAYCIPEPLAFYRIREGSISNKKLSLIKYNWNVLRKSQGLSVFKALFYSGTHIVHSVQKYYIKK